MTNKIKKSTNKKLKELHRIIAPCLKWEFITTAILIIIALVTVIKACQTTTSYKDSILHEINNARNILDYTMAQRRQNVRNRANFSLQHYVHVSESFADNLPLKNSIISLYEALSAAQKSAEELRLLLLQSDSNPQTVRNREDDIKRAISFADKVGPELAKHISGSWNLPPQNMSNEDRIKYYETKLLVITSAATDSEVKYK